MTGAVFMPETLKVRPGATVEWSTTDKMPHTITSRESNADASSLFNSGILSPAAGGKQWEMRFDQRGTFDYFCMLHPGMAGKVVVAGEPIEEFSRLAFMMLMAAGVFGTFGAVAVIRLKQK
jgi:plastocyanin